MRIKQQSITLGDICIDVVQKSIKNVRLSVYPPVGRVRIAAPLHMDLEIIRAFAISKLHWIKQQQNRFRGQERETAKEYVTRECHYFLGKSYLLKVIEHNAAPKVMIEHETMEMYIRPNTSLAKRQEILEEWYRQRLKEIIPQIISKYETTMKVRVNDFGVKKMRTKWGTCNIDAKRIWLNLELAKKLRHYLEYVVLHEMTHLLERRHDDRFIACMEKFMPQWRLYKEELNRSALSRIS